MLVTTTQKDIQHSEGTSHQNHDISSKQNNSIPDEVTVNNFISSIKAEVHDTQRTSSDGSCYDPQFQELQEISKHIGEKRKRSHRFLFDGYQSDPESENSYQKQAAKTNKDALQPVISNLDLYMNPKKMQRMRIAPAELETAKKPKVSADLTQSITRWKASVLSPEKGFTDETFPSLIQFSVSKLPARHEYPIYPNDLKIAEVIGQFDRKFIATKINDVMYLILFFNFFLIISFSFFLFFFSIFLIFSIFSFPIFFSLLFPIFFFITIFKIKYFNNINNILFKKCFFYSSFIFIS